MLTDAVKKVRPWGPGAKQGLDSDSRGCSPVLSGIGGRKRVQLLRKVQEGLAQLLHVEEFLRTKAVSETREAMGR